MFVDCIAQFSPGNFYEAYIDDETVVVFQCLEKISNDCILAVDDEDNVFDITQDMLNVSAVRELRFLPLLNESDATMAS